MNSLSWKCLAVLAVALVASGCGDGGPRLYKAGGTVTYKAAPVDNANVTFVYDDGSFSSGTTDKDGKFSLSHQGRSVGAALGKCKVGVTKVSTVSAAAPAPAAGEVKTQADVEKQQAEKAKAMRDYVDKKAAVDAGGAPQSLIPVKYADASASGLSYEITSNESANTFAIELKD